MAVSKMELLNNLLTTASPAPHRCRGRLGRCSDQITSLVRRPKLLFPRQFCSTFAREMRYHGARSSYETVKCRCFERQIDRTEACRSPTDRRGNTQRDHPATGVQHQLLRGRNPVARGREHSPCTSGQRDQQTVERSPRRRAESRRPGSGGRRRRSDAMPGLSDDI